MLWDMRILIQTLQSTKLSSKIPFAYGASNPYGSRYSSPFGFDWGRVERRQKEASVLYAQLDICKS